jgi:S-DNA-T family DNA segregation ATPase FtsK/SpoIIIE
MFLDRKYKNIINIALLLFLFLGLFVLTSLLSYAKDDPSFSNIVFTNFNQEINNICGKFGAYIADVLYTFLGWAAVLVPFMCFFVAFLLLLVKQRKVDVINFLILFILLVFLIVEFSILSGLLFPSKYFLDKFIGGVFGLIGRDFLINLFGSIGSLMLATFVSLLTIFLMLSFMPAVGFINTNFFRSRSNGRKNLEERTNNKKMENKKEPASNEKHVTKIDKINKSNENIGKKKKLAVDTVVNDAYFIPIDLLERKKNKVSSGDDERVLKEKGSKLEEKLRGFGVDGAIRGFYPGPVVTLYEFEPAAGIKINKIINLENDLALAMSALSVRIIAPIPGKSVVGIELPNKYMDIVNFRELIEADEYINSQSPLTIALGKDISGKPYIADLRSMPHLLVAGTTGSGKSVCINSIIASILFKTTPDIVKFVLIDPKMVELSMYEGIPHLAAPVVTDTRNAPNVLKNVVREMERRYQLLADKQYRNIESYNEISEEKMSYLVVIVDEFADLMLTAGKDVEQAVIRISQMARAVGIHLVLATQRPSVNVITGIIKANMPARLSFRVSSKVDSRTILDQNGAETLLGKGDSLFMPPGTSNPIRVHGCFISESDVKNIVGYLKTLGTPEYDMDLVASCEESEENDSQDEEDEKYYEALDFVRQRGEVSISLIQRHLRIGYNRAARIVELMEKKGIISPSDGTSRPRKILL